MGVVTYLQEAFLSYLDFIVDHVNVYPNEIIRNITIQYARDAAVDIQNFISEMYTIYVRGELMEIYLSKEEAFERINSKTFDYYGTNLISIVKQNFKHNKVFLVTSIFEFEDYSKDKYEKVVWSYQYTQGNIILLSYEDAQRLNIFHGA